MYFSPSAVFEESLLAAKCLCKSYIHFVWCASLTILANNYVHAAWFCIVKLILDIYNMYLWTLDDRKILKCQEHTISLYGSPYYHSTLIYLYIYYCDDSVLYSEDEPQETFPASRVISSQILGYDGGEVDTKERVEVIFPVHVSLSFICLQLYGR